VIDSNSQEWIVISNIYQNSWFKNNEEHWYVDSILFKYDKFSLLYGFNHFGYNKEIVKDSVVKYGPQIEILDKNIFGENVKAQQYEYYYSQIGEVWLRDLTVVSEKLGVLEFSYSFGGPSGKGEYYFKLIEAYIDGIIYNEETSNLEICENLNFNNYLWQNYPNPFNPSTKIAYSIGKEGIVSIKVYDVLGRIVATLIDEYLKQGEYEIVFTASNIPSGIYFYTIRAKDYLKTRKMILLR